MVSVGEQRKNLLMQAFISQLVKDESGTTAIEYGLIGTLITVVCIGGMTLVGAQLQGVYNAVTTAITPAL
jgi:pilus assembly protein Flp/PilA